MNMSPLRSSKDIRQDEFKNKFLMNWTMWRELDSSASKLGQMAVMDTAELSYC